MTKSYKEIIQRYIVLKINSSEWKPGFRIPSENQLAIKFHCSRLTARDALQSLVYSGVLFAKKGSGYKVAENHEESSLRSFAISHNINKTSIKMLEDDEWLKKYFEADKNERQFSFKKEYYDPKGLAAIQFTLLNKNIIWSIDELEIKESLTKFLANQGVAIKYSNIKIKLYLNNVSKVLLKSAIDMQWKNSWFPIVVIKSYSKDGWVEKTIRITRPDLFETTFTKRNFL